MAENDDVIENDDVDDVDDVDDSATESDDVDGSKTTKSTKDKADDGKADLGDPGKKALVSMKRERNAALKELRDLRLKVKEFQDKDKSEAQRLAESAEEAKTRASKAETEFRKLQTAMDAAPEGATLKQIKAVAKRLSGDTPEEMEEDAEELFSLLGSARSTEDESKKHATKPKERLRGGGDPEEEPEETDPRKLAALIGRP